MLLQVTFLSCWMSLLTSSLGSLKLKQKTCSIPQHNDHRIASPHKVCIHFNHLPSNMTAHTQKQALGCDSMTPNTTSLYTLLPHSRKPSREKTFTNLTVLWLFVKVSLWNLGAWCSASNSLPWKFSTIGYWNYNCIFRWKSSELAGENKEDQRYWGGNKNKLTSLAMSCVVGPYTCASNWERKSSGGSNLVTVMREERGRREGEADFTRVVCQLSYRMDCFKHHKEVYITSLFIPHCTHTISSQTRSLSLSHTIRKVLLSLWFPYSALLSFGSLLHFLYKRRKERKVVTRITNWLLATRPSFSRACPVHQIVSVSLLLTVEWLHYSCSSLASQTISKGTWRGLRD